MKVAGLCFVSVTTLAPCAVNAFTAPSASFVSSRNHVATSTRTPKLKIHSKDHFTSSSSSTNRFDPFDVASDGFDGIVPSPLSSSSSSYSINSISPIISAASTSLLLWSASATPSMAQAGPNWGIFEGRTLSLLHPAMMISMLLLSLSTALLGFNWRRQRTIGDDISALKKQLPSPLPEGAKTIAEAIKKAESADEVDAALVSKLKEAIPIEDQINALVAERKELSTQNNRDRHYTQGAILVFLGTAFAIEGPLNTYARAGKLFPGPHLYGGAGIVVLWAAAAACVPFMQKGNDTARTLHITANVTGISLFFWQVVSGWPILLKVIEKTSWP